MPKSTTKHPRAKITGWWKGLPFVAIPFTIFFCEAWFRTSILANHYRHGEVTQEMRTIHDHIQELRTEESHLTRISRIESAAPDLGLVVPEPGDVIVIELENDWRTATPVSAPDELQEETRKPPVAGSVAD